MAVNDPRHFKIQNRLKLGHAVSQYLPMQSIVYLRNNLNTQERPLPSSTALLVTSASVSRAQMGSEATCILQK